MKNTNEIIGKYTGGEATLEQTNAELQEIKAGFHLDPARNSFTPEEIAAAKAGDTPEQANGYGLLDTGTGTLDKVEVRGGKLLDCDCGEMTALVMIGGKTWHVKGSTLAE